MSPKREILVTNALPYANGHLHIGHLVGYIQADIWVRFQRLVGNEVHYMCADDTHGTALMMRARQEGRSEVEIIDQMNQAHQQDFAKFNVCFDHYGSTHSNENRALCERFWRGLREAGLVSEKEISQLYDTKEQVFLADRFVTGSCPRCDSPGQYGDSCDKCGSTYSPTELKNPKSTLSGTTPEVRSAQHLFVDIEQRHEFLESFTQQPGRLQPSIANYLKGHFLSEPLQSWDVSRPAPYFGFEIPDAPGHYWYVWFDAPIGYLSSTQQWCSKTGRDFDAFMARPELELVHFIGKDITYFHTLFWPTMLQAADMKLPNRIVVNGFLTVNGEKMSKSKGTFIRASQLAEFVDPEQLRYYYASRLSSRVDDIDLDFDDFVTRVNSDLVGKVINLASRSARFVQDSGLSATYPEDNGLFAKAAEAGKEIAAAYDECDFARAMRSIMSLADRANEYVDSEQPWKLAKQEGAQGRLQDVCTVAVNLYRQIVIYLSPVLPKLARDSAELFGESLDTWQHSQAPVSARKLQPFKHLMARADAKKVQALIAQGMEEAPSTEAASLPQTAASTKQAGKASPADTAKLETQTKQAQAQLSEPIAPECTFDDFAKVDLRVARVVRAREVPGSRKLLELQVSLGSEERTIFAGIRGAYAPERLQDRLIVVVANLAPRKMKCGISEGMAIAAGPGGEDIFLLSPDSGAVEGQRVG